MVTRCRQKGTAWRHRCHLATVRDGRTAHGPVAARSSVPIYPVSHPDWPFAGPIAPGPPARRPAPGHGPGSARPEGPDPRRGASHGPQNSVAPGLPRRETDHNWHKGWEETPGTRSTNALSCGLLFRADARRCLGGKITSVGQDEAIDRGPVDRQLPGDLADSRCHRVQLREGDDSAHAEVVSHACFQALGGRQHGVPRGAKRTQAGATVPICGNPGHHRQPGHRSVPQHRPALQVFRAKADLFGRDYHSAIAGWSGHSSCLPPVLRPRFPRSRCPLDPVSHLGPRNAQLPCYRPDCPAGQGELPGEMRFRSLYSPTREAVVLSQGAIRSIMPSAQSRRRPFGSRSETGTAAVVRLPCMKVATALPQAPSLWGVDCWRFGLRA